MLLAGLLGGCASTTQPTQSALSRNVGPGSSVDGVPRSGLGPPASGNTIVPGAPAAGPVTGR